MPIYQYSGLNAEGRTERGMMPGPSKEAVTKKLESKGLQIQEVSLADASADPLKEDRRSHEGRMQADVVGPLGGQVSLQQLQFFFRQLSSMLGAGIGTAQAMDTLSGQTQSLRLREVLQQTKARVIAGDQISEAFQAHPEVFNPMMLSLVRAGEEGGFLTDQCKLVSEYIQREIELRNLIKKETLYPKVVLASSIVIILGAKFFVASLGKETNLTSPLTEPATWIILGPIIILLFVYFKIVKKNPRMQYKWDQAVLKVPFIGQTSQGFAMAKFGRSFGALYKGGVPLPKAIKLSADACGNEFVRSRLYPAADGLERGEGITSSLAATGVVSPIVLDMTQTGEMTGNLDQMLEKMSEYYEEEGAVRARQAAVIFGVAVLLATGVYVAYVIINFYMGYASGMTQV
ncbi:MAG: type II secretion system F family protein [Armatimonadetes bacterium]|nr:type II secretion system F family protein [Armatimonadota bacterium]